MMKLDRRHNKVDILFEIIQYLHIKHANSCIIIVFFRDNLGQTTWCIVKIASQNYDSCDGVIGLHTYIYISMFGYVYLLYLSWKTLHSSHQWSQHQMYSMCKSKSYVTLVFRSVLGVSQSTFESSIISTRREHDVESFGLDKIGTLISRKLWHYIRRLMSKA